MKNFDLIKYLSFIFLYNAIDNDEISTNEVNLNSRPELLNGSLVSVYLIARHGARAPNEHFLYPKYVLKLERWPNGVSQLTDKGCNQMFQMGQQFRIRYGQNLSLKWSIYKGIKFSKLSCKSKDVALKFDPVTNVHMVSSNKSRTISSAHAFFKGFFSIQESCDFLKPFHNLSKNDIREVLDTGTRQISSWIRDHLNIVPIKSYNTRNKSFPIDFPFTVFNYFTCLNFSREIDSNNLLNENSTLLSYSLRNRKLMEILSKNSGFELDELVVNAARIEDSLACDFAENPEFLPDWIKHSTHPLIFEKITHFADLACVNTVKFDRELQKHVIGVLVNYLLRDMKRKIEIMAYFHKFNDSIINKPIKYIKICTIYPKNISKCEFRAALTNPKLDTKIINVFMAHDFTLYALLTYLNYSYSLKPAFGSAFVFELWFNDRLNNSNNHIDISHFTLKLFYRQSDEEELKHIENVKLVKFIESFQLLDLSNLVRYLKFSC
ncbi:unnamed protein product [Gordionus sp. m RMFG-2023]|uniref:uncharacterized protein LOC135931880 n=1 Tax=Gordionus sp. m RMFG-2023 TaxID=3053472 RepID=UPI0030E204AC